MIVRAIEPRDADAYRSILERTTEEDRYCRFFHVVNHFDLGDVRRFVEQRPDTIGFIAEDRDLALGVAHAFLLASDSAEIAIVVARDARRRGVGRALLEEVLAALQARGCTTASAVSLSVNSGFARLAQSVGMESAGMPGDTTSWRVAIAARSQL